VNGKVTLAAQKSIFITNDIVYASAQSPNPWSGSFNVNNVDDYVGLVASNSVIITMKTNVNIHAAIMVTSGVPTATPSSVLEGFSAQWNGDDLRGGGRSTSLIRVSTTIRPPIFPIVSMSLAHGSVWLVIEGREMTERDSWARHFH
jgi:hypothetical protein